MAHWFKIRFDKSTPISQVLIVVAVVTRKLTDSSVQLSVSKAMLAATRFPIYFGDSAISNIISIFCGTRALEYHTSANTPQQHCLTATFLVWQQENFPQVTGLLNIVGLVEQK